MIPSLLLVGLMIRESKCYLIHPPHGMLKFNVDHEAMGKPGKIGIAGVLHNDRGWWCAHSLKV